MRSRFAPATLLLPLALMALAFGGACSTDGAGSAQRQRLPGALGARWTPPEFATRPVEGERAAVLEACVATANALGFSVNRLDGASGKLSAARRQGSAFDGARQETLEVTVSSFAPAAVQVAIVLREAEELSSGGLVTSGLIRERAAYDAFFSRLGEALRPAGVPAAPEPPAVPAVPATTLAPAS